MDFFHLRNREGDDEFKAEASKIGALVVVVVVVKVVII